MAPHRPRKTTAWHQPLPMHTVRVHYRIWNETCSLWRAFVLANRLLASFALRVRARAHYRRQSTLRMSSEEFDEGRHHSPPMSPRLRCLRNAMENSKDVVGVKKALESGANANGTWSWLPDNPNYSYTPTPALFHAVLLSNSVRIIRLLVKYGADLDQQVEHWGGPLHMACRHGNVALVKN